MITEYQLQQLNNLVDAAPEGHIALMDMGEAAPLLCVIEYDATGRHLFKPIATLLNAPVESAELKQTQPNPPLNSEH